MTAADRVHSRDVTLGDKARADAEHYGIRESQVQLARALAVSTWDTPEFVMAVSTLPDGRRVQMSCAADLPAHVIKLRLI